MTHTASLDAARIVPGVDCTDIAPVSFPVLPDAEADLGHRWSSRIAPRHVSEAGFDWFMHPRPMVEALQLAFGDGWRIDVLPTVQRTDQSFLLTHRTFGIRLLSRMEPDTAWCCDPYQPLGASVDEGAAGWVEVTEARREWLRRTILVSVDTEDLRSMITAIGVRPEQPRPEPGAALELGWLLCAGLIEVWLAEHGYTGDEAAAIRTLIGLGGLGVLDAYENTPNM